MGEIIKMCYNVPIEDFDSLKDEDKVFVTWLVGTDKLHHLHDETFVQVYGHVKGSDLIICGVCKEMDVEYISEDWKRYDLMYDRSTNEFFNLLSIGAMFDHRQRPNRYPEEIQDTDYGTHSISNCFKVINKI